MRLLSLGRDASKVSPLTVVPVYQSAVLGHSVVPHNDGPVLPPDAGLEVGSLGQMSVQEVEDGV
ncbi:hypothetical protein MKX07_003137 [Trichoderma sp. CBMAI-0711]|nr:hypothetical protein MKX07_003137 [Trichoderma sp. CBMAI-0711]